MTSLLRLLPWMLALALASTAPAAPAEPYTVDHMLRSERLGAVLLSPDERHVLFERIGPYENADRFDLGFLGSWSASEVWIADRDDAGPARPFLVGEAGRGVILGDFSPSGRRLMLHRLRHDWWESGVAELETGEVRWLGSGAEPPTKGETAHWRSDDELVLVLRADGDLPYEIGGLARAMRETERRRRATAEGGVATTQWSAGDLAARSTAGASMIVLHVDLRSGARTVLAEGPVADSALSPDGRWLALATRSRPVPVGADRLLRPGGPAEALELEVLDLAGGGGWRPCEGCDVAAGLLAWSEAGRLLVWTRDLSRNPQAGRLLSIRPAERRVEALELGALRPEVGATLDTDFTTVRAAWMGETPILLARDGETGRADWRRLGPGDPLNLTASLPAEPGGLQAIWSDGLIVVADGAAWEVDREGDARRLEAPVRVVPISTMSHWASPRLRLNTPARRSWVLVRGADDAIWRLGSAQPAERLAEAVDDLHAAGETLAVDRVVENGVETLRLLRPKRPPRLLATLNPSLAEVEFARPLRVTTAGAPNGYRESWLYAPVGGLQSGTPVVIVAYPGGSTHPPENPAHFSAMANVQLLAGLGYAVLVPSLPGAGPEGPGAGHTDRILAVLDAALAQHPQLDGGRVGYLGHSFGGYTGLVLATETDRIHSFVILSASADLAATWGAFSGFGRANQEFGISSRRNAGWAEAGQGAMGGPPWMLPEVYRRNSPFYRADAIQAPVLLLHGELDFVPVQQAESMFTALWRQDKDVQLVTYWGEHHLFVSPGTIRDAWARIGDWFARTLSSHRTELGPARVEPPSGAPMPPPRPRT